MREENTIESVLSLPTREWTTGDGGGEEDDEDAECTLCLEKFAEGETITTLACKHFFHQQCVERWLLEGQAHQKRRCPLCNQDPFAVPEPTTPSAQEPLPDSAPLPNPTRLSQTAPQPPSPALTPRPTPPPAAPSEQSPPMPSPRAAATLTSSQLPSRTSSPRISPFSNARAGRGAHDGSDRVGAVVL